MYCQGQQKAQENTGSLASRIHFGHYMASIFNPEILLINATLTNIPLQTVFLMNNGKKVLMS